VAVAAVFATGSVVSGSTLEGQRDPAGAEPDPAETGTTSPKVAFTYDRLLTGDEIALLVDGRAWRDGRTGDNREGSGRVTPCQQQRYADPDGVATMVRTFTTSPRKGEADVSAVQYAELSRTTRSSKQAWRRALQWYAGCVTPRMQLVDTHAVSGIGDGAHLFHLRSWKDPSTTYVVGVAHTGQILTVTSTRVVGDADPDLTDAAGFLAGSINGLCTATPNARCASDPEVSTIRPVRVGEVPGLVIEADLPQVSDVDRPWVGTPPLQARTNPAATGCDRTDFAQRSVSHAMTRTFVIPRAGLPQSFGLTETVGTLSKKRAKTFVQTVRDRMASCERRDLGAEVEQLETFRDGSTELAVWRVTSEVTDDQTVTYLMGIARVGTAIGQVGFVPAPGVFMEQAEFTALVRRATDRLGYLPEPGAR
jgi:hypothetical protein